MLEQSLLYIRRRNDDEDNTLSAEAVSQSLFLHSQFTSLFFDEYIKLKLQLLENAGLELDDEGSVFADSTSMRAGFNPLFEKPDKTITPYVIMCATMWHENEREMEQILFSVLRYVPKQLLKA